VAAFGEEDNKVIPAPFSYHRPKSVAEAVALLSDLGDEARPLAGGHSLIPLMKLRLATPANLVDLGGIGDLKFIRSEGGDIVIGAMTTQHEIIGSDLLAQKVPILREAAMLIADPQVRYVGTIGGNAANGDPGNDMPAILIALGARYQLAGKTGERQVAAREFYKGLYFTALEPGEILTAIHISVPPRGHGYAYQKLKRKIGDYATAGAAVILTLSGGRVTDCAITLTNVADHALYAEDASKLVVGSTLDGATIARAAAAAEAIATPAADNHGPVEYRTKMVGVMVKRALARALARAAG
jgi:carbon-monoxide dehydrogenase medium subunit